MRQNTKAARSQSSSLCHWALTPGGPQTGRQLSFSPVAENACVCLSAQPVPQPAGGARQLRVHQPRRDAPRCVGPQVGISLHDDAFNLEQQGRGSALACAVPSCLRVHQPLLPCGTAGVKICSLGICFLLSTPATPLESWMPRTFFPAVPTIIAQPADPSAEQAGKEPGCLNLGCLTLPVQG